MKIFSGIYKLSRISISCITFSDTSTGTSRNQKKNELQSNLQEFVKRKWIQPNGPQVNDGPTWLCKHL